MGFILERIFGLLILFAWAAALITFIGAAAVAWRMCHPFRLTFGAAIARGLPTTLEEARLTGEEVTVKLPDGETTPAWIVIGDQPDGPSVIITHGWSNSRYAAVLKAHRFLPLARRIVVYDLRGHGDSSASYCQLGAAETPDLLHILDQLSEDKDRWVLFGSSMGAGITICAAGMDADRHPDRVAGVILDGPYRYAMEPVERHLRLRGWPAQPFSILGEWLVRVTVGRFGRYDRALDAARLRCPLLILHGSDDPICPLSSARQIAQAAKDGKVIEFAGGGHGGLANLDQARYDAAIAEFVQTLKARPVANPP